MRKFLARLLKRLKCQIEYVVILLEENEKPSIAKRYNWPDLRRHRVKLLGHSIAVRYYGHTEGAKRYACAMTLLGRQLLKGEYADANAILIINHLGYDIQAQAGELVMQPCRFQGECLSFLSLTTQLQQEH